MPEYAWCMVYNIVLIGVLCFLCFYLKSAVPLFGLIFLMSYISPAGHEARIEKKRIEAVQELVEQGIIITPQIERMINGK